jgi:hypothetical protein
VLGAHSIECDGCDITVSVDAPEAPPADPEPAAPLSDEQTKRVREIVREELDRDRAEHGEEAKAKVRAIVREEIKEHDRHQAPPPAGQYGASGDKTKENTDAQHPDA